LVRTLGWCVRWVAWLSGSQLSGSTNGALYRRAPDALSGSLRLT
jgi:hypothetical protein